MRTIGDGAGPNLRRSDRGGEQRPFATGGLRRLGHDYAGGDGYDGSGTAISVTIAAPTSSNLCMPPFIVGNAISSVTATVVMNHQ